MRSFSKPAIGRSGLLIALFVAGTLTACEPDDVSPKGKGKTTKNQTESAPPRGNNGGGG